MNEYSALELFQLLNQQDECDWIEAKGGHESSRSVMETVCAFSNEPGLGGGYILLGVAEENSSLFPEYKTNHISDPDKFQRDFVSRCSTMFNIPLRPKVTVEKINGDTVIKILVHEVPHNQKPIFFKSEGLPKGAYRRIASTDQHCTEDDLHIFYADTTSYDQNPINGSSISQDLDETALKKYRSLREKVNPFAEELSYDDNELLQALGCLNRENKNELNLSGLVLFGNSKALRSFYPMLRIDYIRVPGNTWIQDPDERFTTIDMRGPLLTLIYRLMDAINADLPKGFLLPDDGLQATPTGLPTKALREAIVNAVMHRSYREHRPIQIIRYDNRIEIINPGYSLKSEERLGEPGSETRNPFIAAVFHETNLAETKGSGIRAMRKLMTQAHLAPPTFDSDRSGNQFVMRLLLHHFLDEKDLVWLRQFENFELTDSQKQALIFVREIGAIDNQTYRQMSDCDSLKASNELRLLKSYNLLTVKGKGKATYYVPGGILHTDITTSPIHPIITPPQDLSALPHDLSALPNNLSALPIDLSALPQDSQIQLTKILEKITLLPQRIFDKTQIEHIILELCELKAFRLSELAKIIGKSEKYLFREFIKPLIKNKSLKFLYPEMTNHPEQAYVTNQLSENMK